MTAEAARGSRRPQHDASRRRVVFLAWRDRRHPEAGGSELFVERVAQYLQRSGWDVTVCAAAFPHAVPDEIVEGVRIRRRGGRLGVYLHGLAYLLSRDGRRADVVVDVQNGVPFFTPLVRRRGVINLVHHLHREQWQIIYPGRAGRLGWWLESRVAPRLYHHARYVTVSESTRQDLGALGIAVERIDVVHNGIDVTHPRPRAERADVPTVCVLGRLVPHKQVEHALQAAARLRPDIPDLRVEVVGGGWWGEELGHQARERGVDDLVRFHGVLSAADRDAVLDRAWVLLAPSVKEGWGIAIMEAAAHGVPAIAYASAGGVCESIVDGETGWLVDDLTGLVKRTEELLTDRPLRDHLGSNARVRAGAFDWASAGRGFERVLRDLGYG